MSAHRASLAGIGMALAAAALWGTTGTAQTLAPAHLSPYWTGALRLVVSGAFFAAVAAWTRRGQPAAPATSARDWGATLAAGVCMAAYNLAFFAGVKATGVAVGTALAIGSGPVWAGVLQSLLARRPPAAVWWLGTLLAVAGGSLMVLGGAGGGLQLDRFGVALCLAAGLAYAVYTLLSHGLVARASPATVTLRTFGTAAVLAAAGAWAIAGPLAVTPAGWLTVGYLGVVATGVAYLLFSHALRRISAATGVTLALGEPVTAFMLALLVVGERPAGLAVAGLGLVLGGLVIVVATEARRRAG